MKRNASGARKRHPILHAERRDRVQDKLVTLRRFLGKTLVPEIPQYRYKSFSISGACTPLAGPLAGCVI